MQTVPDFTGKRGVYVVALPETHIAGLDTPNPPMVALSIESGFAALTADAARELSTILAQAAGELEAQEALAVAA